MVIPLEDLKFLEAMEDQMDLQDANHALKEAQKGGIVSLDTFKDSLNG